MRQQGLSNQEMGQQAIYLSGNQTNFHCSPKPIFPNTNSVNTFGDSQLIFNTHLPKLDLFLKNQSGSSRTTARATAMDLRVTAESFYDLLGIPNTGSLTEIKQAYKQLALKYHPDVSPPDRTEEHTRMFIQVQEAYETLSDPKTRALYDRDLARGLHMAFSGRKSYKHKEGIDERDEWKSKWESQIIELKRRSMNRDSKENMSWGARMRRQRAKAP